MGRRDQGRLFDGLVIAVLADACSVDFLQFGETPDAEVFCEGVFDLFS